MSVLSRRSYVKETNILESLLSDLNECKGETDVDALIRAQPHAVAAPLVDDSDVAGVQV